MEYPTLQGKLIMPEYGRNIQRMVEHALTLTNREERNLCAAAIIKAMMQLNPELDSSEKRHTFYDHLAMISDFQLDIDYPYGEPQPEELKLLPEHLQYSNSAFPFRHYGKIIQAMIAEAVKEEDEEKRLMLTIYIANRLKYTYLVWNKNQVEDEVIMSDVERLSKGRLTCDFEGFYLLPANELVPKDAPQKKKKKK